MVVDGHVCESAAVSIRQVYGARSTAPGLRRERVCFGSEESGASCCGSIVCVCCVVSSVRRSENSGGEMRLEWPRGLVV